VYLTLHDGTIIELTKPGIFKLRFFINGKHVHKRERQNAPRRPKEGLMRYGVDYEKHRPVGNPKRKV
jgi:hypothetical protein